MKTIKIFVMLLCFKFTIAQEINLYNNNLNTYSQGEYYKDVDSFLNQYEGTWVLNATNYSIKFKFIKKYMHPKTFNNISYFEDYLVGEYQYIENGIEKINTLSNLNINHTEIYDYNIVAIGPMKNWQRPICTDCTINEKRLQMIFNEPALEDIPCLESTLILKKNDVNGLEKIKVFLRLDMLPCTPLNSVEEDPLFSFPLEQYFILTKQP